MKMLKDVRRLIILFIFLAISIVTAKADIICLKSGVKIEGIIEEETDETVIIAINIGKVTYPKTHIESISKSSNEENAKLKEEWAALKGEREAEQREREKFIAEQKTKGLIFHQGQWITREEFEKLNEQKTKKEKPKSILEEKASKIKPAKLNYIVRCEDGIHMYAVRLPSNYNKRKKFPVLFCFDPGGNGRDAARHFREAADKHNWIVVGSLDSKNGPWEPIFKAHEAMLKDIPKRFSVDTHQFYAAGLSGGAKSAYVIAYKNPTKFKGIIACASAYDERAFGGSGNLSSKIAVCHTAGKGDFNLEYIREAHKKLQSIGAKSKLVEFDGGHEWPPPEIISDALNWIEKQGKKR